MQRAMTFAVIIATFAVVTGTAAAQAQWYKGNLHTHTLWSDGDDFPEMVVAWYADRDYDFLALSDHNVLSRGERWITLLTVVERFGSDAVQKYLDRYGEEWIDVRGEGPELQVRLRTLEEVRGAFQKPGEFILLEAEEITDDFQGAPVHINATNVQHLIGPQHGDSVRDVIRNNLLAIEAQSKATGQPLLGHLNHPNYGYAITAEDMAHVLEERFFEVFNGHPSVHHLGDRTHPPVEHLWDLANTIRLEQLGAPPLFGLGTDDSHNYHSPSGSIPGRGWVMVRAESLDAPSIIAALKAGDFYASSGVVLRDVRFDAASRTLTIEIEPDPDGEAKYVTRFIGTRRDRDATPAMTQPDDGTPSILTPGIGETLAEVEGLVATYTLRGDELYVRAMILSSRPVEFPVVPGQRRQAWTQPVGWTRSPAAPSD